jgi:hypothetical protein
MESHQGRHINCAHYRAISSTEFLCGKDQQPKRTCNGCRTCPNCNGLKGLHQRISSIKRDCTYVMEIYICAICGAYYEYQYVIPHRMIPPQAQHKCQVAGCAHTAYEQHRITFELHGQLRTFIICESHHRRQKTWRQHPGKGDEHRPIIIIDGILRDNPHYHKKQGKRHEH